MNHGAGQQKATDNTREFCETWIEEYGKTHDLPRDAVWSVPAAQLSLF
jgi:deoxyribodipyrimidine photolyase